MSLQLQMEEMTGYLAARFIGSGEPGVKMANVASGFAVSGYVLTTGDRRGRFTHHAL